MIESIEPVAVESTSRNAGLSPYEKLHLWMIVPMVLMQLGIYRDYWGDFLDNAWSVHVHYWTGTVWYLYLIIQPYLATHGRMPSHRTNGIIGMFIAGAVCLTAFSMMSRDIENAQNADQMRDRFGPFEGWFFMGVAAVEIVMITAFGYAIIKSIIHRKKIHDHAWWLISSVFIIIMPALGRGIQNIYVRMHLGDWPHIDIMAPLYLTQGIIITTILLASWKYNTLRHPATALAIGINSFILFLEPIGRSETVQAFLKAIIKS